MDLSQIRIRQIAPVCRNGETVFKRRIQQKIIDFLFVVLPFVPVAVRVSSVLIRSARIAARIRITCL